MALYGSGSGPSRPGVGEMLGGVLGGDFDFPNVGQSEIGAGLTGMFASRGMLGGGQIDPSRPGGTYGGTAAGRAIGAFTGRWMPGMSNAANEVRTGGKTTRRPIRRQPMGAPSGAQPYTPNPYGVDRWEMAQHPERYNQGENLIKYEDRRYLGGYSDDYVSRSTASVPYGSDNLSLRYHANKDRKIPVYGKPVYREGDESRIASRLSVDDIRGWQAFFQAQGWKTGPSGFWTSFEQNAMRDFMTMANGTPGGGMKVEILRSRIAQDVKSGALQPGALAPMLGSSDLNEAGQEAATGEEAGGGGGGADLIPYTETTVEKTVDEISSDQGLMVLRDYWQRSTGRAPSDAELSRWVKGVNASMRADPTVITTVVTHDPEAGTTETERTADESNVDPGAMALRASEEDVPQGERLEYQSSRYMDALLSQLGS